MSNASTAFRVTTLNMLPAEETSSDAEDQKRFIRKRILNVDNSKLVDDSDAMKLLEEMGSDLSINAFAVNFKANNVINDDIFEANELNKRIFQRTSITCPDDDIQAYPLILTSTELRQAMYGSCLTNFKHRLGLIGEQDLYTLINVVSSPFPTEGNFTAKIAAALQGIIEQEVETSIARNTISKSTHGFIMQGTSQICLVHLPMFNMANHRHQLVITGELDEKTLEEYQNARTNDPNTFFTLANADPALLSELIVTGGSFKAVIDKGLPPKTGSVWSPTIVNMC
jgi:hypothetical protein